MSGCSHSTALVAATLVEHLYPERGARGVEIACDVALPNVSASAVFERFTLAKRLAIAIQRAHPGTLGVLSASLAHEGSLLVARVHLLVATK